MGRAGLVGWVGCRWESGEGEESERRRAGAGGVESGLELDGGGRRDEKDSRRDDKDGEEVAGGGLDEKDRRRCDSDGD